MGGTWVKGPEFKKEVREMEAEVMGAMGQLPWKDEGVWNEYKRAEQQKGRELPEPRTGAVKRP